MSDPSMSVRERQACFGPLPEADDPELVCKAPVSTDDGLAGESSVSGSAGHGAGAHQADATVVPHVAALMRASPAAGADYTTVSISAELPFLANVGVTASHTVDRFGHEYWGLGMGVGVGVALPVSVSESSGRFIEGKDGRGPTDEQLHSFLCGDSVGAKGGMVADAGITNSSGGTAIEWGATTAVQVGLSFGHNWGKGCNHQ
jgi:hypothetical protein